MYHSLGFHCCNIDVEKNMKSHHWCIRNSERGLPWVFHLLMLVYLGGYDVLWWKGQTCGWCWINIGWWTNQWLGGRKPELGVFRISLYQMGSQLELRRINFPNHMIMKEVACPYASATRTGSKLIFLIIWWSKSLCRCGGPRIWHDLPSGKLQLWKITIFNGKTL